MTFNSSRSAFTLSRQALRPCMSVPARQQLRFGHNQIVNQPTALREKDDPLNEDFREEDLDGERPRWSYTPERMIAAQGFSLNQIRVPSRAIWQVNEDPAKLDHFYDRFLGPYGSKTLPEELKWLAVTHKSFDYGRRGFNTRLAFFGRQIMVQEVMNHIMASPGNPSTEVEDPYDRKPYNSPALNNVDKLSIASPQDLLTKEKMASIGLEFRLHEVTRWKPRVPERLKASGIEMVLTTSIFAIVGAVSLQHGSEFTSKIVREKILRRLRAPVTTATPTASATSAISAPLTAA